jgi:Zn-dependent protease
MAFAVMSCMARLGRIGRIDIELHWTLLVFLLWIAAAPLLAGRHATDAIVAAASIVVVFATIVLHELAHAAVARRYGIVTRSILLLPIGGMASMDRMPDLPSQELRVALAGPMASSAIAAALYAVLRLMDAPLMPAATQDLQHLGAQLMWVNVALALFNLLPAFPMDGGRVLRALLELRWGRVRATAAAATVGKGVAITFVVAGVLFNPMLILIALFVWVAGAREAETVRFQAELGDALVEHAMLEQAAHLGPDDSLRAAATALLGSRAGALPVVSDGRVVGILTRRDLARELEVRGAAAPVRGSMQPTATVDVRAPLSRAAALSTATPVVVTRAGAVAGLLTHDLVAALAERRRIARIVV